MAKFSDFMKEKSIQDILRFSIINLDKPTGPTSFQISQYLKDLFKLNKTSHFGTLDPMVTGVLPVALGRACRLNEYFMHRNKVYVGIMRVHEDVDENKLKEAIKEFTGKIKQLPPLKSRVKRAIREREVKSFEIIEINGKDILFKTEVQAGTYIRKLIHDIGEKIGGAHMLELRRTEAGIFKETDKSFKNLYDLDKFAKDIEKKSEAELREVLIPADEAIKMVLPVVNIKRSSLKQILTGKPLMKSDLIDNLPEEEVFAIFGNDEFIGVMRKSDEKDIIARPEFILN